MNRFIAFFSFLLLPVVWLHAQQDFEGKIVYTVTHFTEPVAKTDSFIIWMSGGKFKTVVEARAGTGPLQRITIIADADKDSIYLPRPDGKYNAAKLSLVNMIKARQHEKQFYYDSMVLYGHTCYKYLLAGESEARPGTTIFGWYSPAYIFTPGHLHLGFPYFNEHGQLLLKRETFEGGRLSIAALATTILPGKVDPKEFVLATGQ